MNYEEWKKDYLSKNPQHCHFSDWELRAEFSSFAPAKQKIASSQTNLSVASTKDIETNLSVASTKDIETKLDELNENLKFFKRYIFLITIALFVMISWTALVVTGKWWKWFNFLF